MSVGLKVVLLGKMWKAKTWKAIQFLAGCCVDKIVGLFIFFWLLDLVVISKGEKESRGDDRPE